ncbi:hypothetical protein ACJQWK_01827 [Exserohilum turcicum]
MRNTDSQQTGPTAPATLAACPPFRPSPSACPTPLDGGPSRPIQPVAGRKKLGMRNPETKRMLKARQSVRQSASSQQHLKRSNTMTTADRLDASKTPWAQPPHEAHTNHTKPSSDKHATQQFFVFRTFPQITAINPKSFCTGHALSPTRIP